MSILKKVIEKSEDSREFIEDFLANNFLVKIETSTKVDEIEEKAIITAISCAEAYFSKTGLITTDVKQSIAKQTVSVIGKANKLLQKQLKKKSQGYLARHKEDLK